MHLDESHSRHGMTEVAASDLDFQVLGAFVLQIGMRNSVTVRWKSFGQYARQVHVTCTMYTSVAASDTGSPQIHAGPIGPSCDPSTWVLHAWSKQSVCMQCHMYCM
jgi:hypothetical protein